MTMKLLGIIIALSWIGMWLTPDQQGQRLMRQERYSDAAQTFDNPLWRGVAWYRAGEFEKATQSFSRVSSAEARFNLGNSWLMLGKYSEAISAYQKALALRPDWKDAQENIELAAARAKAIGNEGGDAGDQRLGADKVVFDKKKTSAGQDTQIAGEQIVSDASIQAMWLRQVQTKPADFLKAKFAFQHAQDSLEGDE